MAEVESPKTPVVTQERLSKKYNIFDKVRRLINQGPDLPREEPGDYETDVRKIEPVMISICKQLKPDLERGTYGLIIGDDTSGRLESLTVKGAADFVSNYRHVARPGLIFLQAGHHMLGEDVDSQFRDRVLSQKNKLQGRRALLVTDYINAARVINYLAKLFIRNGISFDVAAGGYNGALRYKLSLDKDTRLIIGDPWGHIYDYSSPLGKRADLTGMMPAFVHPGVREPAKVVRRSDSDQDYLKVPAARRDVKRLVARTVMAIYG